MKTSSKLIVFQFESQSGDNIVGFKIVSPSEYKEFTKALKLLENNQSQFSFNNSYYEYSSEYFSFQSINSSEIKSISKFFDVDSSDNDSSVVGFFPNVLDDAYDEGLINDDEDEEDFDDGYYQEDDEY